MLPNYLVQNQYRIINWPTQNPAKINDNYFTKPYSQYSIVAELAVRYRDNIIRSNEKTLISKQSVIDLFKEDRTYLAGTSALIWGGISRRRNRENSPSHFERYLQYPQDRLERNLDFLKELLLKEDFETAFNSFQNDPDFHISGLGPSFFTKLFYFVGQSNNEIMIKPLIFDNYTKIGYCALLLDLPDPLKAARESVLDSVYLDKNKSIQFRSNMPQSKAYSFYVKDFNSWSRQLGVSSSKLEEFIFGKPMVGKNKSNENPRFELFTKLLNHFKG